MPTPASLPASTRRLFAHYEVDDLESATALPFAIGRLLEEGDRADLLWLIQRAPEPVLRDWVERHGSRHLSNRSRAFWRLLLGVEQTITARPEGDVWPL